MATRKSVRRPTLSETAWPSTGSFATLANEWAPDATARLLGWVWEGYERLIQDLGEVVNSAADAADLERDLSQLLEPRVRAVMPDLVPFYVQHGAYERETRQPPPAQPPCYDLAFVAYANPRMMWPLEAKILKHDGDVTRYVADVNEQFMTCRYAPFSSEGAMLGYLLSGDPSAAFEAIQTALDVTLEAYGQPTTRPHRFSRHRRIVPPGRDYRANFVCHHLMMRFSTHEWVPEIPSKTPAASRRKRTRAAVKKRHGE
jgi:hypothetical protein